MKVRTGNIQKYQFIIFVVLTSFQYQRLKYNKLQYRQSTLPNILLSFSKQEITKLRLLDSPYLSVRLLT